MTQLELELTETAKWEDEEDSSGNYESAKTETARVEDEEDSPDNYESALGKAIAYWRNGRYIPMTLAVELMAEGYVVCALEANYLKV